MKDTYLTQMMKIDTKRVRIALVALSCTMGRYQPFRNGAMVLYKGQEDSDLALISLKREGVRVQNTSEFVRNGEDLRCQFG